MLKADALSMLALQHDAQRPRGHTNEEYTLAYLSRKELCLPVAPHGRPSLSGLAVQEMSAPPCCFTALGGAWSCMLMTLLTAL